MKQPNKQTAIYCRAASYDDFGFALDNQKFQLAQYAREYGYTDIVVYMDNGFSGLNFDRPSFANMQQAIQDGQISTVLVKDVSRIGRSYIDVTRWVEEMELAGVEIIAIDNPGFPGTMFDFDTLLAAALKGGERE